MTRTLLSICALGLALAVTPARADDRPPSGGVPLSSILAGLERQGYGPFKDIEFDDGVWEIEVYRDGRKRELKVSPRDGRVISDRDDD